MAKIDIQNKFKQISLNLNDFVIHILKYILIIANSVIVLDAIFLLISEKDSYEGEFIEGRHKVSRYLLLMLYVDIQSILMILIAVFGIIGVKKANLAIISLYGLIIAMIAILSVRDLDAFVIEVFVLICTTIYGLAIHRSKTEQIYNQLQNENIQKV